MSKPPATSSRADTRLVDGSGTLGVEPRCPLRFQDANASAAETAAAAATRRAGAARKARFWRALGSVSIAIGTINAFVPLLPTTVFWIIGVWAYSKGSPEMVARLLSHPRFGPGLRLWFEHRIMTRAAKIRCLCAISLSYALTLALVGFNSVTAIIGAGLLVLMAWLGSRRERVPITPSLGARDAA